MPGPGRQRGLRLEGSGPAGLLGRACPDLILERPRQDGGGTVRLATLQQEGHAVLIHTAGQAALASQARAWHDRVAVLAAEPVSPEVPAPLLVRPDGYVAWPPEAAPETTLVSALRRWFGEPRAGA
ncbi:aromatic-ring hydroxylase C-terminal domain-containing protein [Streptomyces sp. NPDC055506]